MAALFLPAPSPLAMWLCSSSHLAGESLHSSSCEDGLDLWGFFCQWDTAEAIKPVPCLGLQGCPNKAALDWLVSSYLGCWLQTHACAQPGPEEPPGWDQAKLTTNRIVSYFNLVVSFKSLCLRVACDTANTNWFINVWCPPLSNLIGLG